MTTQEFKTALQNKDLTGLHILVASDKDYLGNQYMEYISKTWNVKYLDDDSFSNLFRRSAFAIKSKAINIYRCDQLRIDCNPIADKTVIIFCNQSTNINNNPYVTSLPKLETWQIKDYLYSRGKGVKPSMLDSLATVCNNDLFRLSKELDKISIFPEESRNIIFEQFVRDGIFSDLCEYNIFDLSNAIMTKNGKRIGEILSKRDVIDLEPIGLLIILTNNFRNVIKIQLNPCPTPENCRMKENQFWAIKNHNCGFYTKNELLKIFSFLLDMDKRIKLGEIPMDKLIDYLISYIMLV